MTSISGLRVCLCTPDYVYLVKNGGIGTSSHHTARTLSRLGAEVTVVFANVLDGLTEVELETAQAKVKADGFSLEFLLPRDFAAVSGEFFPGDIFTVTSYLAYQALRRRDFDVIIFADWRGIAYYSAYAKSQGLAFGNTALCVQAHSTSLWHELNNQSAQFSELDIRVFHYERKSIELCDCVFGATQHLMDWMRDHGFKPPERSLVLPLIIDATILTPAADTNRRPGQKVTVSELVFFGRLEKRKGLHLFLQALQRLERYHSDVFEPERPRVTFLGKLSNIDGENAADYIDRAMSKLAFRYTINPSLSSEEAVRYLSDRPCLAVMPSLTDNSPLTFHECIAARVPFVGCATGGIPEIVHQDDHAATLTKPFSPALASRLAECLRDGQILARPAVDQTRVNIPRWCETLHQVVQYSRRDPPVKTPLVSICITHYERPALLRKTLKGLGQQTYKNFEIILVDNGSQSPDALYLLQNLNRLYPDLRIELHRLPDLYAGAARNLSLSKARGEYLIFMDDDNYAPPSQVETFVRAITASGFDALSSAVLAFSHHEDPENLSSFVHLFLPAGSGLSLNLFSNSYGDANGIYKKSSVVEVGGFTEERLSWEDYELYSKMEHAGMRVGVVPEPLLYLRHSIGGVSRQGSMLGNYYRALRPALASFPWETYGDALLTALNPGLSQFSAINFDDVVKSGSSEVMANSQEPIVISRILVERTAEAGRREEAYEQLMALAASSPSLSVLELDALFLDISLHGGAALTRRRRPESINRLVDALGRAAKDETLQPVNDELKQQVAERPLLPDEQYVLGLAELFSGEPVTGMRHWSTMLAAADTAYLTVNRDVASAIEQGYFRTGLSHYLHHGMAEERLFGYRTPYRQLFATSRRAIPIDFFHRLNALKALHDEDALVALRSLVMDVISSGSVLAAAELAGQALSESEARYLGRYPDVVAAVERDDHPDGADHWLKFGYAEPDRFNLVGRLGDRTLASTLLNRLQRPVESSGGRTLQGSRVRAWLPTLPPCSAV